MTDKVNKHAFNCKRGFEKAVVLPAFPPFLYIPLHTMIKHKDEGREKVLWKITIQMYKYSSNALK